MDMGDHARVGQDGGCGNHRPGCLWGGKGDRVVNIIDRIVLTPEMVSAWTEVCRQARREARKRGIDPAEALGSLPDEAARDNGDGSVTIYVPLPVGGELAMRVPRGQWAWNN